MIAVVLDTAVVVLGLGRRKGPGTRLMRSAIAGSFVPVTTPRLIDELARTLRRRELREAFPDPPRIVSLISAMCMVIEPPGSVTVMRDEAANHLLDAAGASGARYLVAWNLELLALGRFGETRIVRPT